MQLLICIAATILVSLACFSSTAVIGYKVVALVLLVMVSVLAMLFDILPVLAAAFLSALIWNYFFIPPIFTFHIDNTEDLLLFLMYFLIALVNAVLTFKIREAEKKARDREEKENTIRLYNTVLNSLTHEMQTPLSAIIGAVDTLRENTQLAVTDREELLNSIGIAGDRLTRLVQNLLNMNRLETGMLQLKKDWCDMNELIFGVIRKCNDATNQHRVVFDPDENLPLFKLDSVLMEQVIQNLIHNAILYTPEDTEVTVSLAYEAECCVITVSDQGGGFPEAAIPLVFDKFYRLPNSKAGGTGLGLSIAKGFTEAHGGSISLENLKQGGAKFTVVIPAETTFINKLKNE